MHSGPLPICASCKIIRDDKNYGQQVEAYNIYEHSEVEFSHGVCLDCARKLYPNYTGKKDMGDRLDLAVASRVRSLLKVAQ